MLHIFSIEARNSIAMTSLFSKSLCASILTAIIVVRSQTADIFDLTKAAFGLDERPFLDSSFTGNRVGLTNAIPKRESDIIEDFQRNNWRVYSFLSQLYQTAMDVADKKWTRKEAFAIVKMYYDELSERQQSELDRLSKDIKQLLSGKASTDGRPPAVQLPAEDSKGGSSYSTEKRELQNMLNVLSGLQCCRKEFTETVFRIRGLLKGEPVSFAAQDFKQILDSFKKGVQNVVYSSNQPEDIEPLVYAYRSFCNAVAAGNPSIKSICSMTVTYAEALVAAGDKKNTLKELADEMQKVENRL